MQKKVLTLNKTERMASEFKKVLGRKAKILNKEMNDIFRIKLTKDLTKESVLEIINNICKANKLPNLDTSVSSPYFVKNNCRVGIHSLSKRTKKKTFKTVALVVYFQTDLPRK